MRPGARPGSARPTAPTARRPAGAGPGPATSRASRPRAPRTAPTVAGRVGLEVVVGHDDGVERPRRANHARQAASSASSEPDEVVDGREAVGRLLAGGRLAPARHDWVCTARHSDTACATLSARVTKMSRTSPSSARRTVGQVGAGQAVQPARAGRSSSTWPHMSLPPQTPLAVVALARGPAPTRRRRSSRSGRARPQRRQAVEDRRVVDARRSTRAAGAGRPGGAEHLEVLERHARRRRSPRSSSHSSVLPLRGVAQTR